MEEIDEQTDSVYLLFVCRILDGINHNVENFSFQDHIYLLNSIICQRMGTRASQKRLIH